MQDKVLIISTPAGVCRVDPGPDMFDATSRIRVEQFPELGENALDEDVWLVIKAGVYHLFEDGDAVSAIYASIRSNPERTVADYFQLVSDSNKHPHALYGTNELPSAHDDLFDAWILTGGQVKVSGAKAKNLLLPKLRAARDLALKDMDAEWFKAYGNQALMDSIAVDKQKLRDATLPLLNYGDFPTDSVAATNAEIADMRALAVLANALNALP